jgi:hypothetical protein
MKIEIDVMSLQARSVDISAADLTVTLLDGRRISTPLNWYPRLQAATHAERSNYEIMPLGIHWPDIDEDLSISGMLQGIRP